MAAPSNGEIARRGFEAALGGDLDALREFLDPDVRWHGGDPEAEGACRDRTETIAFLRRALTRQQIAELVDVREAGDKVVLIMRRTGAPGAPDQLVANVTTMRDGRAMEMVHYAEVRAALAAAGLE